MFSILLRAFEKKTVAYQKQFSHGEKEGLCLHFPEDIRPEQLNLFDKLVEKRNK